MANPKTVQEQAAEWLSSQNGTANGTAGTNGTGSPHGRAPDPPPGTDSDGPRPAKDIILDYLRAKYRPAFRRADAVYSTALGREVHRPEACSGADSPLVGLLADAADCPRQRVWIEGREVYLPNTQAIPRLYKLWVPTAWADLWGHLDDEDRSEEIPDDPRELFRSKIIAILLTHQTIAVSREGMPEPVQEKRTLIQWCRMFAKTSHWADVRGFTLWCRQGGAGLELVIYHPLCRQTGFHDLAALTQTMFVRLCHRYEVGEPCRPGRLRGVLVAPEIIAMAQERPADTSGSPEGTP